MNKNTLVVNLYAGPGAGKTACAWLISGELKKKNIVTEYVPEYAKELVWDEKTHLLDGSFENQLMILNEQDRRIKRLVGKVDVIVTDSPILLSCMYVKEQCDQMRSTAFSMYDQYNNFNLFITRGNYFEQAGRVHDLKESVGIDNEIKSFLNINNIFYGTYRHSSLDVITNNIQTTMRKTQIFEAEPNELAEEIPDVDEDEDCDMGMQMQ